MTANGRTPLSAALRMSSGHQQHATSREAGAAASHMSVTSARSSGVSRSPRVAEPDRMKKSIQVWAARSANRRVRPRSSPPPGARNDKAGTVTRTSTRSVTSRLGNAGRDPCPGNCRMYHFGCVERGAVVGVDAESEVFGPAAGKVGDCLVPGGQPGGPVTRPTVPGALLGCRPFAPQQHREPFGRVGAERSHACYLAHVHDRDRAGRECGVQRRPVDCVDVAETLVLVVDDTEPAETVQRGLAG